MHLEVGAERRHALGERGRQGGIPLRGDHETRDRDRPRGHVREPLAVPVHVAVPVDRTAEAAGRVGPRVDLDLLGAQQRRGLWLEAREPAEGVGVAPLAAGRDHAPAPGNPAPHQLVEDQPRLAIQHRLGHRRPLEPENVEALVVGEHLAEDLGGRERHVRRVHPDHAGGAIRMEHGHGPRHEPAPVVPDEDGPRDPERVEQPHEVPGELLHAVRLDRLRRVAAAVAALVGRDRAEAGGGQRGELVAPRVRQLGKAMAEHHRGPLARFVDGQGDGSLGRAGRAHPIGEPDAARRRELDRGHVSLSGAGMITAKAQPSAVAGISRPWATVRASGGSRSVSRAIPEGSTTARPRCSRPASQ